MQDLIDTSSQHLVFSSRVSERPVKRNGQKQIRCPWNRQIRCRQSDHCPMKNGRWLDILVWWAGKNRTPRSIDPGLISGRQPLIESSDNLLAQLATIHQVFDYAEPVLRFLETGRMSSEACRQLSLGWCVFRRIETGTNSLLARVKCKKALSCRD